MEANTVLNGKENLLLVIAHPGDETLYFYGGLLNLREKFNIDILCLASSSSSRQGKNLIALMQKMNIQVIFRNLSTKQNIGLNEKLENYIKNIVKNKHYSTIITYSPTTSRLESLKYSRCFFVCRRICKVIQLNFGFFSNQPVHNTNSTKLFIKLDLRNKFQLFFDYCIDIVHGNEVFLAKINEMIKEFFYFCKSTITTEKYNTITFNPPFFDRHCALENYSNQIHEILSSESYLQTTEYLYLNDSFFISNY